jgi:hypothetical protein
MTLPDDTIREVERLTRLARESVDPNEAAAHRERRDAILADHGYTARVRSDDTDDVLVLHPSDWLDESGTVQVDRIDDVDDGIEVPLSGPGDADDWDSVERHNRAVAEWVAADHGAVHGRTAHSFADFMSNHYAKPVEQATPAEVREFVEEYFPRNTWPTDDQRAVVEESVELVRETAREQ